MGYELILVSLLNFRCILPADKEAAERSFGGQSKGSTELFDGRRRRRRQPDRMDVRPRAHRLAAVRLAESAVIRGQFTQPVHRLRRASGAAVTRRYQRSLRLQRPGRQGCRHDHSARFASFYSLFRLRCASL